MKGLVKRMVITVIGPESFREQQHNQPIEIATQKMYEEIVWYIHQNPVVSGFVFEPEAWVYSSAKGSLLSSGGFYS